MRELDHPRRLATDPAARPSARQAAAVLGLQFYAGIPLRSRDGDNLGTLCIIDRQPRTLSQPDLRTLEDLAAIVMNDLKQWLQSRRCT